MMFAAAGACGCLPLEIYLHVAVSGIKTQAMTMTYLNRDADLSFCSPQ
jgi:hypothetical protein